MTAVSRLIALVLFFNPIGGFGETLDGKLNDAFKKVWARNDTDAEGLKWLELHWIKFRDAEANLEAWIAGKTKPDETARAKCLEEIERARFVELDHMAETGIFVDLKPGSYREPDAVPGGLKSDFRSPTAHAYAALRKAVIAMQNPNLTSALIRSQTEWLRFSELQADGEGMKFDSHAAKSELAARENLSSAELFRLRLQRLQGHARALGVDLDRIPVVASDRESVLKDDDTALSPDASLRIEQHSPGDWVISNRDGERSRLPDFKHGSDENTGNSDMSSEYVISPNGRWIIRDLKIYHGLNGVYLYERISSGKLDFKPATSEPLDILAWKFFRKATRTAAFDYTHGGVVNFVSWRPGSLRLSLNAKERDVIGFIVEYDLRKRTFAHPR